MLSLCYHCFVFHGLTPETQGRVVLYGVSPAIVLIGLFLNIKPNDINLQPSTINLQPTTSNL